MIKNILYQKVFPALLFLFFAANIYLLISGKSYYYTALYKGKGSVSDYSSFEHREVQSQNWEPWLLSRHYNLAPVSGKFLSALRDQKTIALLVVHHDSIAIEDYWQGYTEDSYSNTFALTNTIVSALTGIAIKEGCIRSLDQPVADFLEFFSSGGKERITIRHLLTMSSGLRFRESTNPFTGDLVPVYYGTNINQSLLRLRLQDEPGTVFSYKSIDVQILGMVISKATGKSLSKYASEKLWQPLEAKHPAKWSLDRENGTEKAFCCFNTNVRDLARLARLYLNNGKWKGQEIIPEDFITESLKPINLKDAEGKLVSNYGFHWWILENGKSYYSRGNLGQYMILVPEKNMAIVRLASGEGPDSHSEANVHQFIGYSLGQLKQIQKLSSVQVPRYRRFSN